MRTVSILALVGLLFATWISSAAPRKSTKARGKSDLQTDVRFDDAVLHGQYQVPEEALAKVENEKVLSYLLGVRKHFKDRLLESAEQE